MTCIQWFNSCNTVSKILLAKQIECCDIYETGIAEFSHPREDFLPPCQDPSAVWWGEVGPAESWEVADYLKYQISDIEAAALSWSPRSPLQSNYGVLPSRQGRGCQQYWHRPVRDNLTWYISATAAAGLTSLLCSVSSAQDMQDMFDYSLKTTY